MFTPARHLLVFAVLCLVALAGLSSVRDLSAQPPQRSVEQPHTEAPAEKELPDEVRPQERAPEIGAPEELPGLRAVPAWLGVLLDDGFAPHGVLIVDIAPHSPAEAAGLRPGDLIRRLADSAPRDALDVATLVGNRQAGDVITLVILRAGVFVELSATLAAAPDTQADRAASPPQSPAFRIPMPPDMAHGHDRAKLAPPTAWLGVETAPVTNLARRLFHLPSNRGAVVSKVYAGSPAQRAGIMSGAVIRAIDSRQVTNPRDVARFVAEAGVGRRVEISLWADDVPVRLFVRLDIQPLDAVPIPRVAPPGAATGLPSSERDKAKTGPTD